MNIWLETLSVKSPTKSLNQTLKRKAKPSFLTTLIGDVMSSEEIFQYDVCFLPYMIIYKHFKCTNKSIVVEQLTYLFR